jgi:hypothetical protein
MTPATSGHKIGNGEVVKGRDLLASLHYCRVPVRHTHRTVFAHRTGTARLVSGGTVTGIR